MAFTTLNALEEQRSKTFVEYSARVGEVSCCGRIDLKVSFLESALETIYRFSLAESRGELKAGEVHDLWKKTVEICDFFIDHVRLLSQQSQCPVTFDKLLDVRLAADEKTRFHGGCE